MRTPISYYGDKQTLLKRILPLIPKRKPYTEAFCGDAAVLFAKRPADGEIINNIGMDIASFYWMAKVYYHDLGQETEKTLHSWDAHARAGHILQYPQLFQPVQRTWAVRVLCKMFFANMMDGSFGYDSGGGIPKKLRSAEDEFTEWLCIRLDNVAIGDRDALDVISTYDSSDTFHFIDPPYISSNCGYYEGTFDEYCIEKLL